jgi:hypothetical protein
MLSRGALSGQPSQNCKLTETQEWKYVHQHYTQPLNSTPLATLIQEGCVGRYLAVFRYTHNHLREKFRFQELSDHHVFAATLHNCRLSPPTATSGCTMLSWLGTHMTSLQLSKSLHSIQFMVQGSSRTRNGHQSSTENICFLWYLKSHSCIRTYPSWLCMLSQTNLVQTLLN